LPPQALVAQVTIGGILLVALVAAFLPVPMAFDVAIAYIAMTKGVPLPYVVTILCTLGIISVYSLSVVGKSLSWRVAAAAYATVAVLGTIAGVLTRNVFVTFAILDCLVFGRARPALLLWSAVALPPLLRFLLNLPTQLFGTDIVGAGLARPSSHFLRRVTLHFLQPPLQVSPFAIIRH